MREAGTGMALATRETRERVTSTAEGAAASAHDRGTVPAQNTPFTAQTPPLPGPLNATWKSGVIR